MVVELINSLASHATGLNRKRRRARGGILAILAGVWLLCAACAQVVEDTLQADIDVSAGTIDELLDQYTDSRRYEKSDMRILAEADDSYNAFAELIQQAECHINIETLTFDDDTSFPRDVGLEFVQMLAAKAQAGVQVNVLIDPFNQVLLSRPELEQILRAGGVVVRDYIPPEPIDPIREANFRTHKKLLVADGRRAITGSANFGFRYLTPNEWRETNVLLTGPVVAAIQDQFVRDWTAIGGELPDTSGFYPPLDPTGTITIRPIDQRPGLRDFDINDAVVVAIRKARNSIFLESPYFNPTEWFVHELVAAAQRGVTVQLLTNSGASTDFPIVVDFGVVSFDDLLDGGVHISLWLPPGRNLHSKVMVVDDQFAMIGSYNLNSRSIAWDTENAIIVTDPAVVAQARAVLDNDACCDQVMEVDRAWLDDYRMHHPDFTNLGKALGWVF